MVAAAIVAVLFAVCAWPLVFSENLLGRAAFDQLHYHEPAIRTFAAELPSPNLRDYRSATTPGYHLLLAVVCRVVTDSGMWLQFVSSLFTIALLGAFAFVATRTGRGRMPGATAVLLTLPIIASIYVFFPGVWLLPDNLGWLLVLGTGVLSWRIADRGISIPTFFAAAVLLAAVVLTRQSHLWVAAMVWLGAWIGASPIGDGGLMGVLSRPSLRVRAFLVALVATVPAVLLLLYFKSLWNGLTPPMFAFQYRQSWNPAAPAFILTLVAIFSVFFMGYIWDAAIRIATRHPVELIGVLALGGLAAAIPATTYVHEERSTGLWNLVRVAPVIADHTSVVLLIGAPLGAWAMWAWFEALGARARWFFVGALAAFGAAQTANPICWQRYIEPLLLIAMGLGAASLPPAREPGSTTGLERFLLHAAPIARVKGPIILAVLFAALVVRSLQHPDVPWNTEIGPDGRRRVVGGVLVIPGVRMEEQEHRIPRSLPDTPPLSPSRSIDSPESDR